MKFLCPSCKAKYQIADEKVIGRTVKMKCRQCGHVIEINEAVMAQSTAPPPQVAAEAPKAIPHDESNLSNQAASKGKPPPKPTRSATPPTGIAAVSASSVPKPTASRPFVPKPSVPSTLGARTGSSGTLSATRPLTAPLPDKPRPSAVPAPRPAPVRPAPTAKSGQLVSRPLGGPHAGRPLEAATDARVEGHLDSSTRESAPPSSRRALSPMPVEARVASSPTGGASSGPSVGRLPGVPEKVVSSLGAGAARPAATQQDPLAGAFTKAVAASTEPAESTDHPLAGDEWYVGVHDQPIGPIRLAEIRDRAAKGEITPECLVWRDGFEDWKPLTAFPELIAVVEEGVASYRSLRPPPPSSPSAAASEPTSSVADQSKPVQIPSGAPRPSHSAVDDELLVAAAGLSKPKIPISAWLAVLMALALGVTIGLVVIKPDPPKQIIKYVEVPVAPKQVSGEAPPPAPAAEGENGVLGGEAAQAGDKRPGTIARKTNGNGVAETPSPAPSSEVTQGLKGLQGLQGLGAPRTGPASEVGASAARQQLDSATLSRTVSRYTASVKRSCWQPALDTRAPDAATSARISANIVVASSGKVQSVTVSPDPKGYHGLSSCIQSRVRNWEFPPAGGSTEFNVPFVFAAQ